MPRRRTISNEKILEVARQVFLEKGFGASTLEIADQAGISEASIFKRFSTKQALFQAAMSTAGSSWMRQLEPLTPTADCKAILKSGCLLMFNAYTETMSRVMMLMAQGRMQRPPMPPPFLRDVDGLAQYLEQAIALNLLRPCDPHTLARLIVGAVANYVMAKKMSGLFSNQLASSSDPEIFIHDLIETLWAGIDPASA